MSSDDDAISSDTNTDKAYSDEEGLDENQDSFYEEEEEEVIEEIVLNDDMEVDPEDIKEIENDSICGFYRHKDPVYKVSVHPLRSLVISGGGDDSAYLWNYTTGDVLFDSLEGHFTDTVDSCAFSADGQYVSAASIAEGTEIYVWNVETGKQEASLTGPAGVSWQQWHPSGNALLVGSPDLTVWMYMLPLGNCLQVFGHSFTPTTGSFTPNGKKIVTGTEMGEVHVLDPKTGSTLFKYTKMGPTDSERVAINCLAFTEDSNLAISGSENSLLQILHMNTQKVVGTFEGHHHTESIESIAISKINPNILMSASIDGKLNMWDMSTLKLRETAQHETEIYTAKFLRNSCLVATGGEDGIVRIWDSRSGKPERSFMGHRGWILDLDCTEDTVISGSDDGSALVFSLKM